MKTQISICAGLMLTLITCQTLQGQIKYGIHGGLNIETQAEIGELWNNCDFYQGYMAGAFVEYFTGKNISLQAELNYQKKGEKTSILRDGASLITRREFNYMTIPVLVRYYVQNIGLGGNADLVFMTGPYAGFLTSANSRLKNGSVTTPVNIEDRAEKTDAGALFGIGLRYRLPKGNAIFTELRYQMGLKQIDADDSGLRNKGAGITLGYSF